MSGDEPSTVELFGDIDSLRSCVQLPASPAEEDWQGIMGYLNSAGETIMNISDNSMGVLAGLNFRAVNLLGLRIVFVNVKHQLPGKVDLPSLGGLTWPVSFKENLYARRV